MYDEIVSSASFWEDLLEIDEMLQRNAVAEGCPRCGGPLHVANFPRKPYGLPGGLQDVFSLRLSTCCGHCRRRRTPGSVRFLGRRVYVGAIMILATMRALVCGASQRTLKRWQLWWIGVFPAMSLWRVVQGLLVPAVQPSTLPGGLLARFEPQAGSQSKAALVAMLRALSPIGCDSSAVCEGDGASRTLTQIMPSGSNGRGLLHRAQAPPHTT